MTVQPINRLAVSVLALAAVTVAVVWWGPWRLRNYDFCGPPPLTADTIEERRAEVADEVARYAPANPVKLDDLAAPLATTLKGLPGVVKVDVPLSPAKPRTRIVHILDWHFVDKELLANVDGRIDWDQFLVEVEAVQLDQTAVLECLARHHGLKRVHIETLTEADMPALPDKVAQLRETEQHQQALKDELVEALRVLQTHPEPGERHNKAAKVYAELAGMLADHRLDMLKMGAAVRLLMSGQLTEVLPLDDAKLLDAAGPMADGKQDPAVVSRREAAMVQKALASGPVAVIICVGSHDLTAEIRKQEPRTDYIRVATRGYLAAVKGGK
jgi:hypothetical protein